MNRYGVVYASNEDIAWYRKLWKPDEDEDGKKKRDKKKKKLQHSRDLIKNK